MKATHFKGCSVTRINGSRCISTQDKQSGYQPSLPVEDAGSYPSASKPAYIDGGRQENLWSLGDLL